MKKFLANLKAALAKLGFQAKFEKRELTADEQAALVEVYNTEHGENAFANDFAEFQKDKKAAEDAAARDKMFKELAGLLGVENNDKPGAMESGAVIDAVKELQATVQALGRQSQGDTPDTEMKVRIRPHGAHTKEYIFGVQHPFYSTGKRYNRIAFTNSIAGVPEKEDVEIFKRDLSDFTRKLSERFKSHIEAGTIQQVIKGNVDYSALTGDSEIGSRYLDVRTDALIARIVTLPNLDGLFTKISNVQSGQILTNVLLTEVSQAFQPGHVFKGDSKFLPEKAIVDKAMVKLRFDDMSALETSYLNYLNKSGSDPVKWSMIEWLILKIATQISNERIRRNIMGYRIEPEKNKPGNAMYASTGVVHRLFGLYDDKKVLPFLDADLAKYSKNDIGDTLILFAEMLSQKRPEDWQDFKIYVNETHRPWFAEWYENKYGKNTDYNGVTSAVPYYNLPIRWVPQMGTLQFIFSTIDDNIFLLENVPGEEFKMQFQRDLEQVIIFSYWKEGAGVAFAGVKRDSLAELKAADMKDQLVFMNWPAVEVAADAVVLKAKDGMIFRTGANTKATAITDIEGAMEGIVYRIETGTATNASTIAKADKFSELKSAWAPTKADEYIKLIYDSSADKFYEVARG